MHSDLRTNRLRRLGVTAGLVVILSGALYAHTYVGLIDPMNVRARVQSPNANVVDMPVPIPGTSDSLVCFKVRNSSPYDARITSIGFHLSDSTIGETLTGFTLLDAPAGFDLIEHVSNVPQLPDVVLDFALVTGRTFGGGRPNLGLAFSPSTLTQFCVSGPFDPSVPIERIIDHGVLRFQRVGPDGQAGDIAIAVR